MEPTFKIQVADNITGEANLIIEVSLCSVTFIVIDLKNTCKFLICYHYPTCDNIEKAAMIIKKAVSSEDILQMSFSKVTIITTYPKALLYPQALFDNVDKKAVLELVYGDINDDYVRSDFVYKQNLHVFYVVPKLLDSVFSYLFKADNTTHQYSLLPDLLPFKENHLYCIFGEHYFTVQLIKNGHLQTIQSFQFKVPQDVVYYLLQICSSYQVPANQLLLQINGMIDKSSKVYGELPQYFQHIQFETLPAEFIYPEKLKQLPSHYFSHLFSLALCVS